MSAQTIKPLLLSLLTLVFGGCQSVSDVEQLPPKARFKTNASVDEVRECGYRWIEIAPAAYPRYHPQGITSVLKNSSSDAVAIIRKSQNELLLHCGDLCWGATDKYVEVARQCALDPRSRPPNGDFWRDW